MTDIDKIFNEFLLSILNNGNATLVKELHFKWSEFKMQPILNDEQPKSEFDKLKTGTLTMDEYVAMGVKSQGKYNQPPSGEFITKEECDRRERSAFFAGGDWSLRRKCFTFDSYKQSLKQ